MNSHVSIHILALIIYPRIWWHGSTLATNKCMVGEKYEEKKHGATQTLPPPWPGSLSRASFPSCVAPPHRNWSVAPCSNHRMPSEASCASPASSASSTSIRSPFLTFPISASSSSSDPPTPDSTQKQQRWWRGVAGSGGDDRG